MAQIIVKGEQVGAKSGEQMPIVNPATEEEVDTVPKGGPEDVDAAVAAAKEALKEWYEENPDERAELIRAGVSSIKEKGREIAQLLVQEQDKPMMASLGKLHHFLHGMSYYADLASKIEGTYATLRSAMGKAYGMVIKKPMGVCAAIFPYDFPLTLMGPRSGQLPPRSWMPSSWA